MKKENRIKHLCATLLHMILIPAAIYGIWKFFEEFNRSSTWNQTAPKPEDTHVTAPETASRVATPTEQQPELSPIIETAMPAQTCIGHLVTKKFHTPSCRAIQQIKAEDKILFSSYAEATAAGYVACKRCKPQTTES